LKVWVVTVVSEDRHAESPRETPPQK